MKKLLLLALFLLCIGAASMKISDYPKTTTLHDENLILISDTNSTPATNKTIKWSALKTLIGDFVGSGTVNYSTFLSTNNFFVSGKGNTLIMTQYVRFPVTTLTMSGSNVSQVDVSAGTHFKLTLTNNAFIGTPTGFPGTNLAQTFQIIIAQDGTGTRSVTWTNGSWKWPGGTAPTQTTNANAVDAYTFVTSPMAAGIYYGVHTANLQ